jgi:hypothetical protein
LCGVIGKGEIREWFIILMKNGFSMKWFLSSKEGLQQSQERMLDFLGKHA